MPARSAPAPPARPGPRKHEEGYEGTRAAGAVHACHTLGTRARPGKETVITRACVGACERPGDLPAPASHASACMGSPGQGPRAWPLGACERGGHAAGKRVRARVSAGPCDSASRVGLLPSGLGGWEVRNT